MRRIKILAFILLGLIVSCGAALPSVPVTHLASMNAATSAFSGETTLVVRDQQTWQDLWTKMNANLVPLPPLPAVDFAKNTLLVAAAGPRPTGGYTVTITGASETSSGIRVDVTIASPGSGCAVPQIVTSPVDIATIERRDATFNFRITRKVVNC